MNGRRVLLSLLAAAAAVSAVSCGDPWGTDDGKIALYVEVDRSVIAQGEELTIVATARNIGSQPVTLSGPADCLLFFEVLNSDGTGVYNMADECTGAATTVTVEAGADLERTLKWQAQGRSGLRVAPGYYLIRAVARLLPDAYAAPPVQVLVE